MKVPNLVDIEMNTVQIRDGLLSVRGVRYRMGVLPSGSATKKARETSSRQTFAANDRSFLFQVRDR